MPTIVELKKQAKDQGFKGYSKLNKKQLETLLSKPPPIKPRSKIPTPPKRTTSKPTPPKRTTSKPTPPPKRTPIWKRPVLWYDIDLESWKNVPKNAKFTSVGPGPGPTKQIFTNKTLSQIKTIAFSNFRRRLKRWYKHDEIHDLTESYILHVVGSDPVETIVFRVFAESATNLKEYNRILESKKYYSERRAKKIIKPTKSLNSGQTVKRNFKKVMNQI